MRCFIGRPDVSVVGARSPLLAQTTPHTNGVATVEVPMADELGEDYLEIREVKTGRLVTMIEVLSSTNKVSKDGRTHCLEKRTQILRTRTTLIESDLLRDGEPIPLELRVDYAQSPPPPSLSDEDGDWVRGLLAAQ